MENSYLLLFSWCALNFIFMHDDSGVNMTCKVTSKIKRRASRIHQDIHFSLYSLLSVRFDQV